MGKTNPQGDEVIRPFPDSVNNETSNSEEGSLPSDGPIADLSGASTWRTRVKRRWKSILAWFAQGAEHACPT
jgi:hypothetical protein